MHCLKYTIPFCEGGERCCTTYTLSFQMVTVYIYRVNGYRVLHTNVGTSVDETRTPETRTVHYTRMSTDADNELEPTLMDNIHVV